MASTIETGGRDFLEGAPSDLIAKHDAKMRETPRWEINGAQQSDLIESNLDHIDDELVLADWLFDRFPNLTKGVSKIRVKRKIYIHDTPEIVTGDDAVGNKDHYEKRQRRWERERRIFNLLVEKHVTDPELQNELKKLYREYNNCRPARWKTMEQLREEKAALGEPEPPAWESLTQAEIDTAMQDRESLIAHFIDKIQASRFGLEHVFKTEEDCQRSSGNIIEYAIPLFRATPIAGQGELIQLVLGELGRFKDSGFSRLSSKAQGKFLAAISDLL